MAWETDFQQSKHSRNEPAFDTRHSASPESNCDKASTAKPTTECVAGYSERPVVTVTSSQRPVKSVSSEQEKPELDDPVQAGMTEPEVDDESCTAFLTQQRQRAKRNEVMTKLASLSSKPIPKRKPQKVEQHYDDCGETFDCLGEDVAHLIESCLVDNGGGIQERIHDVTLWRIGLFGGRCQKASVPDVARACLSELQVQPDFVYLVEEFHGQPDPPEEQLDVWELASTFVVTWIILARLLNLQPGEVAHCGTDLDVNDITRRKALSDI